MPYKTCPSCNKSVGVRTNECKCGHSFTPRKNTQGEAKEDRKPRETPKKVTWDDLPVTTATFGYDLPPEPKKIATPHIYGLAGKPPSYIPGKLEEWLDEVRARRPGQIVSIDAALAHLGHATIVDRALKRELQALFNPDEE